MSRILKMAAVVVGVSLVIVGAVVVYRETDLLTGSLVLLSGLMIAALLARRAAAREERAGMADWEQETLDSEQAAEDLFAEWGASTPNDGHDEMPTSPVLGSAPSVAPPVAPRNSAPATPVPDGAEVPEPADPSVAVSRPLRGAEPQDTEALVASLFLTDDPEPVAPVAEQPPAIDVDDFISTPFADRPQPAFADSPEPAFAGAGAPAGHASPIDWTGQGGRVDERVKSSEDILRASEATALPSVGGTAVGDGGSELARLLAKVEARLRDYD